MFCFIPKLLPLYLVRISHKVVILTSEKGMLDCSNTNLVGTAVKLIIKLLKVSIACFCTFSTLASWLSVYFFFISDLS